MDASSRRAFALNSRTVWVEQQIIHDTVVARENLPLGPGEYESSLSGVSRHVSTPALGKYRGPADHFLAFQSPVRRARSSAASPGSSSDKRPQSPSEKLLERLNSPTQSYAPRKNDIQLTPSERSEFMTIFHGNDRREPLDPRRRFCVTPGAYLGHESVLESSSISGKQRVHNTVPFGPNNQPFGSRGNWKQALPDYEVKYDSTQLKTQPKLGSFAKNKRIYIPLDTQNRIDEEDDGRIGAGDESVHLLNIRNSDSDQPLPPFSPKQELEASQSPNNNNNRSIPLRPSPGKSLTEFRCSLVRLPKLKQKNLLHLEFDDSSYRKRRLAQPIDISPSQIDRSARAHMFRNLVAIPRPHRAPGLHMQPSLSQTAVSPTKSPRNKS